MNGAESLVRSLVAAGVDHVFTNPGSTEMEIIKEFDAVDGFRPVLGLFEGVCTGAADGYARMTGKPAATLLHVGPGLANGLANLHNAKRAYSPVVNMAGDYPSYHSPNDPLLAATWKRWRRRCPAGSAVPHHRRPWARCGGCGRRGARGPGRNLDRPARRHMG